MTLNDLQTKVKVTHLVSINSLGLYTTSYRLPVVTFALGRTV